LKPTCNKREDTPVLRSRIHLYIFANFAVVRHKIIEVEVRSGYWRSAKWKQGLWTTYHATILEEEDRTK
jgi:hypothetical protein